MALIPTPVYVEGIKTCIKEMLDYPFTHRHFRNFCVPWTAVTIKQIFFYNPKRLQTSRLGLHDLRHNLEVLRRHQGFPPLWGGFQLAE